MGCLLKQTMVQLERGQRELLQLLLGTQMVAVSALLLTAVVGTQRETGVALTAHHLVAVVLSGKSSERRLNHTSRHLEQNFNGRGVTDSTVTDSLRIVQLLTSKDETLVVIVDILLLLDHLLDVLHRLCGLNLKRDGISLNSD